MPPSKDCHAPNMSIADALFSLSRQQVLKLLYSQPEHEFSIGELIEKAGVGTGAVQREINRLVECGLVILKRHGRQKRYSTNTHSPVYHELRSLVVKTLGPQEAIRRAMEPMESALKLALLYGSFAKQTDHADSDIDLMLVSDSLTLEDVFEALEPVEKELSRPINPTLYTTEEFHQRRAQGNPFIRKVLEGPYVLLTGSIDG